MSDFEYFHFFFKYSKSFTLCYIDFVNILTYFGGQNISIWDYVFQFEWVVQTFKFS